MASTAAAPNGVEKSLFDQVPKEERPVVCVFCGSSPGTSPAHLEAARDLARAFHAHNIKLVFGGGSNGIMGEVAKTLVALAGPTAVEGIIPAPLLRYERPTSDPTTTATTPTPNLPDEKTFGHTTVVPDMHTRKQLMAAHVAAGAPGSGFVALSGGYGTLEELMEMTTWNQLGIHRAPIVLYSVEDYWAGLLAWVEKAVSAGFVGEGNRGIIAEGKSAEEVVKRLREYELAEGRFKLEWGQR